MVTVIIPTYNGEKTITRAIKSIINQQGNHDFQILVVDDCSTDSTVHIANSFEEVLVISTGEHSGGPNAGRNIGLHYARGDYVAFLDQDDKWLPNKLELQMKEINNGADLVAAPSTQVME